MVQINDTQLLAFIAQYLPDNNDQLIDPIDLRYVLAQLVAAKVNSEVLLEFAQLASPRFTGTPQVPTAPAGSDSDQVASTAFVQAALLAIASGKNLSELVLPQDVRAGAWYLTVNGIWEARRDFSAVAEPISGPWWRLLAGFGGQLATINAANILDATDAGRAMLTAISASAQRGLVNNPQIPAGRYGDHPSFNSEDGPAGAWAWVLKAIVALQGAKQVQKPAAPTEVEVEDTADTLSGILVPGYPAVADYEVFGSPDFPGIVNASAAGADIQNGRIISRGLKGSILVGSAGIRVAANSGQPAGFWMLNDKPFTGVITPTTPTTPTPTPALTPALAISVANLMLGSPVTYTITPAGGTSPYGYEVVATDTDTGQQYTLGTNRTGSWTPPVTGYYSIDATVSDSSAPTQRAQAITRYLRVTQALNRIPVADAGADANLPAGTTSLALMGRATDPDGDAITAHAWRQITGPNNAVGLPATTQNVVASGLVAGTYQFGYRATDSRGGQSDEDFVLVTIQATAGKTGKILIVGDGDSRTAEGTPENPWVTQLRAALPSANYTVIGKAVGGSTSQELLDRFDANITPLYSATQYDACYYVLFTGVNDFHLSSNRDPTATKANIQAAVRKAAALGFKVLVCTSTKVNTVYLNYQPQLDDVNADTRANAASWGAVGVVDLDREISLQNPSDQYVWKDALHLQPFANTVIARAVKRKVDAAMSAAGFAPIPVAWSVDSVYEGGLYTDTALEPVTWTDLAGGFTANGSTINLSRGGAGHSTRAAGANVGPVRQRIQLTVPQLLDAYIGVNDSAVVRNMTGSDDHVFDLTFQSNGQVRPSGPGSVGPYQPSIPYAGGDTFDWQVERGETGSTLGQYSWYKNGVKVGTWLAPVPAGNLQLDITSDYAGSFANVRMAGPNLVTVGATAAPAPVLSSIDSASGIVGDTRVLTGSGFVDGTSVKFGTVAASAVTINSVTQITVVVPAGATTGSITVANINGTSNALAFTVVAGPPQQTGDARLYVEQAGEDVVWPAVEYGSANGSSISFLYVVSNANSSRAIGPSSAALRGFFEYTVSSASTNAGLGLAINRFVHDTPTSALYSITATPDGGFAVRLRDNSNAIFAIAPGDVIRVQIGQSGYSLFINKVWKDAIASAIEPGNLFMALQGNGSGTFEAVKIWGPNLVTI